MSATTSDGDLVVTGAEAGKQVVVAVGHGLVVRLDNTYWRFQPAADSSMLALDGIQSFATVPPQSCIPGAGCGAVSQRYRALRPTRP